MEKKKVIFVLILILIIAVPVVIYYELGIQKCDICGNRRICTRQEILGAKTWICFSCARDLKALKNLFSNFT